MQGPAFSRGATLPSALRRTLQCFAGIALLTILANCASSKPARPSRNPNMITRDQVVSGNYANAYDIVRRLHPNWLVKRSLNDANTNAVIMTYVDGVSYGDINWLKNVQSSSIESIQRIDAGTATTRWGTGHSEGVIYVITTRGAPGGSSTENR